jgi:hypothetical protein
MAAPKDSPEDAFRLRRFLGTNTQLDPAFLGPQILARSQNWIPAQSRRIGKRPGTVLMQKAGNGITNITSLLSCKDSGGSQYLYAYGQTSGGIVVQSPGEAAFVPTPGVTFTSQAIGRLVRFRNRIYAGNGVDPIKSWIVADPLAANTLSFTALATLTPQPAKPATPPASVAIPSFPSGSYQYCWAIFNPNTTDPTTGVYVARSTADQVDVPAQAVLSVTAPAADPNAPGPGTPPAWPAGTGRVYRFFLAPRGFPIEYATAQSGNWAAGVNHTYSMMDVTDFRCPIFGVFRTGNMFLVWRNRVVFAGSQADPYSVYSTDVILPGLEQSVFNQGTIFPVDAKVPLPDKVTGIGIAGVTSDQDAQSPLLFFTLSKTFIATGDPFDANDSTSQLIEISSRVGCVGHDTIVNTPLGTFFVAIDSVYLIPPGGGYPQDVGWPIADQIMAISAGVGATLVATFHKGFYKLSMPSPGGGTNTNAWWLDLRQGVGDIPSWWGPQTISDATSTSQPPTLLALSALASDPASTREADRGYGAVLNTDEVVLLHQLQIYGDMGMAIRSILVTGRFDGDQPFIPKIITRLRMITQSAGAGSIQVSMQTDGGVPWNIEDILLSEDTPSGEWVHNIPPLNPPGTFPPQPDVKVNQRWRSATWRSIAPFEAQTITPAERPRGLSVQITLTHVNVTALELRDFEILFLWSARKVRYLGERVSK